MNQSTDITNNLLQNPPKDLVDLMNDPRTTDEARQAVSELAKPPSALSKSALKNGDSRTAVENGSESGSGGKTREGRLQIVNENQEFS